MTSLLKLEITVLPVYSGSLKKINYPKLICLANPLSFECLYCSYRNSFLYFYWISCCSISSFVNAYNRVLKQRLTIITIANRTIILADFGYDALCICGTGRSLLFACSWTIWLFQTFGLCRVDEVKYGKVSTKL